MNEPDKQPIALKVAKDQLERLNEKLESPLLLIGGLAVQQYYLARNSKDIDLICDFNTIQKIIEDLYPTKDWESSNSNDEYRPTIVIKHRFMKDYGEIIFGPKITERGPYPFLTWESLTENAVPFKNDTTILENILVPTPHALAYSKLISFVKRDEKKTDKIKQDITDFANLTNNKGFLLSVFWNLLNQHDQWGTLQELFKSRIKPFVNVVKNKSCLYDVSTLFADSLTTMDPVSSGVPLSPSELKYIYIAAPHGNEDKNSEVVQVLRNNNLNVKLPYEEVEAANLIETAANSQAIRSICMKTIDSCSVMAVDLDAYGLDTAWELGYGEGKNKQIVGYNLDKELTSTPRLVNRKMYDQNFMHGWTEKQVLSEESAVIDYCRGKVVYVCGSFSNKATRLLSKSPLKQACRELILPIEHNKGKLPTDYPLINRNGTMKLLKRAEVILVVLPRYGMDASWQVGYATAIEKDIIGYLRPDDRIGYTKQVFWDHWMHGWKSKTHLTSISDLATFLRGLEK